MSGYCFRDQLRGIRQASATGGGSFIPQKSLYRLFTRDIVSQTLRDNGVSATHVEGLTDQVLKGGQKLFAILVLLKGEESKIVQFVKHDQFTATPLDSRLPLELNTLREIVPSIATDFYEMQWELIAPIFSRGVLHRELDDMIRLPYIKSKKIGQGGFGDVYEVQLETLHQTLAFTPLEDKLKAVRKEFKSHTSGEEDWRKELQNLSLLSELKHPNLVELLGSYTHQQKHNLIFRLVSHGDLASFFEKDRPEGFESDDAIFHALAQLASAICTIHSFTNKTLDLKFIGCHHDLKPKNVLFDGRTFILADFGLSRFKDATESSKEPFDVGQGHYLAPECEDFEDEFKKHIISRPSDIWSFGCIIAELLTYMLQGPGSTSDFKNARTIKINGLKTRTFHSGRFKANPGVELWLSDLERQGDRMHRLTLQLVRSMLALNPDDRPKAPEVGFTLGYIAFVAYIDNVDDLFSTVIQLKDSIAVSIECKRFRIWTTLFESTITANDSPWRIADDPITELNPVLRSLVKCKEELLSILERQAAAFSPLYDDLRTLISHLHNFLPAELRKLSRSQLEEDLVKSEDLAVLETIQDQCSSYSGTERICMLLTIKRMSVLAFKAERRTRPDLYFEDRNQIEIDPDATAGYLGEHSLARVEGGNIRQKRRVIVEWIRYTPVWEGSVSEELLARVEAIASLLNHPVRPTDRVLQCSGYYHEPSRHAFGVIYEFPTQTPSNLPTTPRTLSGVILSTADTRSRPSLEDRYLLAYQLATSVIDCHKVGWMHKSICAHNIAFFHSQSSHPSSWIQNPYIIGFNHSRPDDPQAFTLGPGMARFREYQHPHYYQGHRFVREFDFYSLGIVLLEIGLWTTLQTLISRWKFTNLEELRLMLLSKRVPLLAHSMGHGYLEAVQACLTWMPEATIPSLLPPPPPPSPPPIGPEQSLGLKVLAGLGKIPCQAAWGSHSHSGFLHSSSL